MIGATISHYKILEKLGEGGMGIVYKAHDTELDRDVALKFLPNFLASDTGERERFYHEARAASVLNHPNITTIYEIGQANDQLFIAMEYVEGKTLKHLIEKDPISLNKVLEFAIQICEGLALAAEKGVVHRDVKSDNIMVTPRGQVKIMDFGLAKLKGASRLTKAGSTLGTAAYMSPEQAQGEEVDHRSDIFSFGVVLYEMLTLRLPFKGEHQAALIYSLVNEDPPPIARFNEKVTPELERVVSKALAKLREDRYQHIDELLADLRRERKQIEYARTGYVKASTAAMAAEPRRPGKKLSRYLALAAGVVLIAVLVLVFNPFNFQVSLQKSTAGGKNSLAVVYFENIPDPADKDHTADMLTNLLITSLSQARDLEVISRERLFEILKDFGQADAKSISPSLATQVAKRAGVKTMLLGTILEKDPNLVVTTRLIEVESGKYIGGQRLTNFSSKQIFTLVDTLAALVRGSLAVAPSPPQESKSVGEITTKSPDAYRYFTQGT